MYAIKLDNSGYRAIDGANQIDASEIVYEGDNVESVVVDNGLVRAINNTDLLLRAKKAKIEALKYDCTNAIQAGFTSPALGETHTYDSSLPQDQTNLLGARIAGIDMYFTCTDSNGYKSQKWHTAAQMAQVYSAGMVHLQTQKARFYARKVAVEQASTIEAVEAVVW